MDTDVSRTRITKVSTYAPCLILVQTHPELPLRCPFFECTWQADRYHRDRARENTANAGAHMSDVEKLRVACR